MVDSGAGEFILGEMLTYTLPPRAFLRLSGPDAVRFLNGQITQKVSATTGGAVLWTAVTNAKGGIEGVGCIQSLIDGDLLLDCPLEIGDEMEARLDKYLIADDCEWAREDERWQITVSATEGEKAMSQRFRAAVTETLVEGESEHAVLPEAVERQWRAEHAVPAWGREILPGMLPAECGLYDLALSFDKGCYIGQEIISRMETAGKTRSKLYQLISEEAMDETHFSTYTAVGESHIGLSTARKSPGDLYPNATLNVY